MSRSPRGQKANVLDCNILKWWNSDHAISSTFGVIPFEIAWTSFFHDETIRMHNLSFQVLHLSRRVPFVRLVLLDLGTLFICLIVRCKDHIMIKWQKFAGAGFSKLNLHGKNKNAGELNSHFDEIKNSSKYSLDFTTCKMLGYSQMLHLYTG